MKKIALMVLAFAIIVFSIVLLTDINKNNLRESDFNEEGTDNLFTQEYEEYTDYGETSHQLYEDYYVLAQGEDSKNNKYYLVATQEEHASGNIIKIGVIKNNEWLVNLSDNTVFHNKEDGNYVLRCHHNSIYECNEGCFGYIGAGCFACNREILFNAKNQKYLDFGDWNDPKVMYDGHLYNLALLTNSDPDNKYYRYINADDGKILAIGSSLNTNPVMLVNLDDMTMTEMFKMNLEHNTHSEQVFPLSEGLFCYMNCFSNDESSGFYNLKGEKIIDLSVYNCFDDVFSLATYGLAIEQSLVFEDEKCEIYITNESGAKFRVLYDINGNILSETKVEG